MIKIAGLPCLGKESIILYGENYPLKSLNPAEQEILEDNFNTLLGTSDSQIRKILEERLDTIVAGIMAIKTKLNREFRGMNPSDGELGFGFIRPEFVKANDAIINDWNVTLTGMGTWDRWLDKSATEGFTLSEEHGLIITHLVSQVTPAPFVRAVHFWVGRKELLPEPVDDILLGDNANGIAVYPITTKFLLPQAELRTTVTGVAGVEYLKLGGLVVGLGSRLKAETPSW